MGTKELEKEMLELVRRMKGEKAEKDKAKAEAEGITIDMQKESEEAATIN